MIDLMLNVRRRFWHGVSTEEVQNYLEELTKFQEKLDTMDFMYRHNLFGSDKLIKEIQELINRELNLCAFYKEYQKRCESEPNFSQWIFKEKEDIKTRYNWEVPGEQWTKSNGKIKAIIQFDRSGKRVKISLSFENDSATLNFMDQYKIRPVHLKNETSIANKVAEFKMEADAYISEHEYPLYCAEKTSIDTLNKLLWINDSVGKEAEG